MAIFGKHNEELEFIINKIEQNFFVVNDEELKDEILKLLNELEFNEDFVIKNNKLVFQDLEKRFDFKNLTSDFKLLNKWLKLPNSSIHFNIPKIDFSYFQFCLHDSLFRGYLYNPEKKEIFWGPYHSSM